MGPGFAPLSRNKFATIFPLLRFRIAPLNLSRVAHGPPDGTPAGGEVIANNQRNNAGIHWKAAVRSHVAFKPEGRRRLAGIHPRAPPMTRQPLVRARCQCRRLRSRQSLAVQSVPRPGRWAAFWQAYLARFSTYALVDGGHGASETSTRRTELPRRSFVRPSAHIAGAGQTSQVLTGSPAPAGRCASSPALTGHHPPATIAT